MINEPLKPASDQERIQILLDACEEAYDFIEYYCDCPLRPPTAKKLRRAIQAIKSTSGLIPPRVPSGPAS